jgi:hypothetical protein
LKKTDRLLNLLEHQGMLIKRSGLWYGEKRLFLSTAARTQPVPMNYQLLSILKEQTGSWQSALLFAKIAFAYNGSTIYQQQTKWCCLKREELARWLHISVRSVDNIIGNLSRKGLILKKNLKKVMKTQSHFHIPQYALNVIHNRFRQMKQSEEEENDSLLCGQTHTRSRQICRSRPAKLTTSIKINTKPKKTYIEHP